MDSKYNQMTDTLCKWFVAISELLGIKWAPRNIPLERRIQTLAATAWIGLFVAGEFVLATLFLALVYSNYWYLGILYGAWMLYDIDICHQGGRRFEWVRNWSWWNYYRDYFPVKLIKTVDLDPERNYLLATFPHGVICSGAFGSFATNALGFQKLFPGMTSHVMTLAGHFVVPFFRELVLALGVCASSPQSILHLLDRKSHKGKCVVLMVGGAAEALDAHPGEYKICLKRRKGFIKVAMKAGAPLVPTFSFGETDVFRPLNNPKDSLLRKFQDKFKQWTGISPVLPLGRGVFQYSYGIVPMRSPVTMVVGKPMEVQRNFDPTPEEIDAVHAEFTERLVELFETEKCKHLQNYKNAQLVIT